MQNALHCALCRVVLTTANAGYEEPDGSISLSDPRCNTCARAFIIHFDAGHDRNGNPRRAYVRFDRAAIAEVWTEGYRGAGAVPEPYRAVAEMAPRIPTTPAFYRTLRRLADLTRKAGAA